MAEQRTRTNFNLDRSEDRPLRLTVGLGVLVGVLFCGACQPQAESSKRIQPVYDQTTGKLQLLKYDANGNGTTDTWSYMDGARVVRIEVDSDEDGKIDRWEYYGRDELLEKIGFSRLGDGKEDAWKFPSPGGAADRIGISTRRDGKITRTEHYNGDRLVSAEEDVDEDGKIDKWETYEGDHLASVAFDTLHRGTPDRRMVYGLNGSAKLEVDPAGDGHFSPVNESQAAHARR
jgi:hypothetical protein